MAVSQKLEVESQLETSVNVWSLWTGNKSPIALGLVSVRGGLIIEDLDRQARQEDVGV